MSDRETRNGVRLVSRRSTLKVCLVPVGAVAARVLGGCSNQAGQSANNGLPMTTPQPATMPASAMPAASMPAAASRMPASAMPSMPVAGSASAAMPSMAAGGSSPMAAGAGAAGAGMSPAISMSGAAGMPSVSDVAGPGVAWATGGTKMMMPNYPDPFAASPGSACKIYPAQTIGPCYAQGPMTRADISDGLGGLPVRMSLLIVDGSCKPVPNAAIDIWHSGSGGFYSAYAMGTICNPGNDNVKSQMFCRGVQMSDEAGRVQFNTVFPGWYQGRTIHIHFTARINGKEYVTSQLYFEDALVDEILAQGDYKARGKRDTTNKTDGIYSSGGATPDQILFQTAKRPDGSLHAWKVVSIG